MFDQFIQHDEDGTDDARGGIGAERLAIGRELNRLRADVDRAGPCVRIVQHGRGAGPGRGDVFDGLETAGPELIQV